jgi:hypothetical protein
MPETAPSGTGEPDIAGIRLGMTFADAEARVREVMDVERVMVAKREWQIDAAVGTPRRYTSGKLFVSKNEQDLIILFDEPPAAERVVVGVARQVLFPRGEVSASALVDQLRQKYGKEVSGKGNVLIWSKTPLSPRSNALSYHCVPAENEAASRTIWRKENGQEDPAWQPKGVLYNGTLPTVGMANSYDQSECAPLVMAVIGWPSLPPGSDPDWGRLEVRLFDHNMYSKLYAESIETAKKSPPASKPVSGIVPKL